MSTSTQNHYVAPVLRRGQPLRGLGAATVERVPVMTTLPVTGQTEAVRQFHRRVLATFKRPDVLALRRSS